LLELRWIGDILLSVRWLSAQLTWLLPHPAGSHGNGYGYWTKTTETQYEEFWLI
jgi:hypothetical protein